LKVRILALAVSFGLLAAISAFPRDAAEILKDFRQIKSARPKHQSGPYPAPESRQWERREFGLAEEWAVRFLDAHTA
jgi:hypothetical protein